jgi:hypothetical protein
MNELNLPRHVVESLEKRWAQKLQQQALAWRASKPPVPERTASGVLVERRSRRPRPVEALASTP